MLATMSKQRFVYWKTDEAWPFNSFILQLPSDHQHTESDRLTDLHTGTQGPVLRASLCCSFREFQDLNLCLCTAFCTHVLVPVCISSQFADL